MTSGVTTAASEEAGAGGREHPRQPGEAGVDVVGVVEVGPEQQDRGDRGDAVEEPVRADRRQGVAGRPVVPDVPGAVDQSAGDVAHRLPGRRGGSSSRSGPSRSAVHPCGERAPRRA